MHTLESELVTRLYEVATDALDDLLIAAGLVEVCSCGDRKETDCRCGACGAR